MSNIKRRNEFKNIALVYDIVFTVTGQLVLDTSFFGYFKVKRYQMLIFNNKRGAKTSQVIARLLRKTRYTIQLNVPSSSCSCL